MNRIILFSLSGIFLSFNVSSQSESRNELNYNFEYDKGSYRYFGAGICYDLILNSHNLTLAAFGLDVSFLGDRFYTNITSRFHVGENLVDGASKPNPTARSVYTHENSRDISITGTAFVAKFKEKKDIITTLKKSANTEYVASILANETVIIGADAGFRFMTTYYNFGNVDWKAFDKHGNEVNYNGDMATFFTQKVLRFGISRLKTVDFKIKVDKYGKSGSTSLSKLYFHTLIGFDSQLDDIFRTFPDIGAGQVYQRLDINTNADIMPVGAAVGYETSNVLKNINLGYMLELGLMPGPSYNILNNVFLDLKIRFNLGKKF